MSAPLNGGSHNELQQNGNANGGGDVLTQIGPHKYNLKNAVKLPANEHPWEWIALNLYDFHKQIRMLYGTIEEYCTPETCPRMTAGKKYEFLWSQAWNNKTISLCATDYIHHLLNWVQEQLDDENVFPIKESGKFPPNFTKICESIAKRLFRVYAHIYHHHSQEVRNLKEEAHMNTSLKHFIYFVQEFNLVKSSNLEPLQSYIQNLT